MRRRTIAFCVLLSIFFLFANEAGAASATLSKSTKLPNNLQQGLVGHWTFDGPKVDWSSTAAEIRDSSESQISGDAIGGMAQSSVTPGKLGQALKFDGVDDKINMSQQAPLQITSTLTISAWIKPKSYGQNSKGRIVDEDASVSGGYILALDNANVANGISFMVNDTLTSPVHFLGAASSITLNQWQHVVATLDSNKLATIYVNGSGVASATFADFPSNASQSFVVGGRSTDDNRNFDGSIDDVRIYNRALTTAEVRQLYNLEKGVTLAVSPEKVKKPIVRTLDDPVNQVALDHSIAIGRDGYPVISYDDVTVGTLKFYKCNDIACASGTASTLDDPANNVGFNISMAIGVDGNPVISYRDITASALKFYKCNDAACTSGTASTLDHPANAVGYDTSIAIGRDGYPVISYYDGTAAALKLYKCNDAACTSGTASTLDHPANDVGENSSIAIGSDGYPVISYHDYTASALKFYKCNNIACSSGTASTLDSGGGHQVGLYTSIAIGRDGYPVISYKDTNSASLKFYRCNNAACASGSASTLDDQVNQVGNYTSIAIGRDGYPVISYSDNTAGALKLYKCYNVSCTNGVAFVVDDPVNQIGNDTSIAIGRDGYPVISYYDSTAQSLKFAYVGALVTQGPCMGVKSVKDADGNSYNTIGIGTQCWLDRNMNVGTRVDANTNQTNNGTTEKYCYSNIDANCTTNHLNRPDGGLYQWDEAMQYSTTEKARGLCPAGFHIPSDAEWFTLEHYIDSTINNSSAIGWRGVSGGTKFKMGGSSGFEGNLSGYVAGGASSLRDDSTFFWSSTENGSSAWIRSASVNSAQMWRNTLTKTRGATVRCIKN